jgi:hypothetical protein
MPGFDDLAADVRRARRAEADAADAAAAARERLKRAVADTDALRRVLDPRDEAAAAERDRLERERVAAAEELKESRGRHAAALEHAAAAIAALEPESDPRKAIAELDDGVPILLLPVRLETRFADGTVLVRIYPDDCSIDSFEETLSETEVENAQLYWIAICEAGENEDQERGAWRGLVAAHGSGRAQWIVQQYRPLSLESHHKDDPADVVLTIATDVPVPDKPAVAAFWEALWLADGDSDQTPRPVNFDARPAPPLTKADVTVSTGFVEFAPPGTVPTKSGSWTRAPRAAMLPDRFVFLGYTGDGPPHVELGGPVRTPLIAGPDPSAPPDEQLKPDNGGTVLPEPMRWMVDFDEAVDAGMGIRVPLGDGEANGFDRVLVVGLRASDDTDSAREGLETLLEHHRLSRTGLAVLPQGTPTNNTEAGAAGHARGDDADVSFDDLANAPLFTDDPDWRTKRDGQWLAEHLGIDPELLQSIHDAGAQDQANARAMNIAMWPATMGYWMETLMAPVLGHDVAEVTRRFFTRFVAGAGPVPAIRIGRQPYGILPATAFSRLRWPFGRGEERAGGDDFLARLYELLRAIDADWAGMSAAVSYAGRPGDAHRTLLDIVGLHPGSVEWSQRWAESVHELYNRLNLQGIGWVIVPLIANGVVQDGIELLRRLGYAGDAQPEILEKLFFGRHNRLTGPVVDEPPLSEADPVQDTTTDGRNYLEWLAGAASTSLDELYRQDGFVDDKPPRALLYLMLRHAVQLGYHDVSLQLHEAAGLLDAATLVAARRDRAYIHVEEQLSINESRYGVLYVREAAITGSPEVSVGDFIGSSLDTLAPADELREQIHAIERLAGQPTARLERAFAEHVDCCSYRLDAWRLGLVHFQLAGMRNLLSSEGAPRRGIHVGAYAWLEDLRPEARELEPVVLEEEDLATEFEPDVPPVLRRDSANQGYIHAPSLNQAVAAAVLRNGSTTNGGTMTVNLTSERVRVALGLLEGVRAGQSLGALLGYRLERGLHDRHAFAEVDEFILDIRRAFPLSGDRLKSTSTVEEGDPAEIEAIEARNVADGLALVEHIKATGQAAYPFGKDLPQADPAQAAAIDAEVERLLDAHDAVADLALAEGVYQAVLGNYDRVASTYDAYAKGNFPPEPDVVRTPGRGLGLTHRVALHLQSGLDASVSPVPGVPVTPRARAEPAVNRWLAGVLPPPGGVGCRVTFFNATTRAEDTRGVTLADLDLQPADLIALLHDGSEQAMAELDDRIVRHALATWPVRHDHPLTIAYMESDVALSVFELLPLVRALRPLVTRSRPLRATDLALTVEAAVEHDAAPSVETARIERVRDDEANARDDLDAFVQALQPLLDDVEANRAAIVGGTDARATAITELLVGAAAFGALQAGWGFVQDFRQRVFGVVLAKCQAVDKRWTARLDAFDDLLQAYGGAPAEQRFPLLLQALGLVSTAAPPALPADPEVFRTTVVEPARLAFETRRDAFRAMANTNRTTVGGLLSDAAALLPTDPFDLEPVGFAAEEDEAVRFAQDCAAVAGAVTAELDRRVVAGGDLLAQAAGAAAPAARADALVAAAKALLGEDFVVVPEFALRADQGAELTKAHAASEDGTLLTYLAAGEVDFPVDTWLYGAARVREKLRAWEAVVMYSGAAGRPEPGLTPLQLPYRDDDRWLALEFPPTVDLGTERLLYTAHFATPFDASEPQCGLLLDEWSEVIPAADADTGLAFHYDRPSSEAPQAMLLVTPTAFTGRWRWDDLVDALNETLDMAKRRAVEPVHVDASPYAPFLPATVMAMTVRQLTISANLAINNDLAVFAEGG